MSSADPAGNDGSSVRSAPSKATDQASDSQAQDEWVVAVVSPSLPPDATDETDIFEFIRSQLPRASWYEDPADCLAQLTPDQPVVFLLDARLARETGLVWLTIFAETGRGPILLIEDSEDESLHRAALRAGAQGSLARESFEGSGAWMQPYFQLALDHFRLTSQARKSERALDAARLEEARRDERDREACERIERFVRDTLHEFRTPLTAIGEFSAILTDGLAGSLNRRQTEYLAYVSEGVQQLVELYDTFRDSMRMRLDLLPANPRAVQLDEIVERACKRAENNKVRFDVNIGDARATLDPELTELALVGVLGFMTHTSPRDSIVRLWQYAVTPDAVELRFTGSGPNPTESDVLLLRDGNLTEGGLSKSVARVFGLGMDLARLLIRRMGGSIDWLPDVSQASGSAVVRVLLPLVESRPLQSSRLFGEVGRGTETSKS